MTTSLDIFHNEHFLLNTLKVGERRLIAEVSSPTEQEKITLYGSVEGTDLVITDQTGKELDRRTFEIVEPTQNQEGVLDDDTSNWYRMKTYWLHGENQCTPSKHCGGCTVLVPWPVQLNGCMHDRLCPTLDPWTNCKILN